MRQDIRPSGTRVVQTPMFHSIHKQFTGRSLRNLLRNLLDPDRHGSRRRRGPAHTGLTARHFPLWADHIFHQVVNGQPPLPPAYDEEIAYLRRAGKAVVFPYEQVRPGKPVTAGCDEANGLPFVLHNGRKLYYPQERTVRKVAASYRRYIEVENILGGGYARQSPHQYQADGFRVQAGDVVVDVGAAEGLFALDVMDLARRIYIIEADPQWQAPLQATFAPFGDKAVLIHKTVAATQAADRMQLAALLEQEPAPGWFFKMDIEGDEVAVLEDLVPRLPADVAVRFACCTYHRHGDAERMQALFVRHGFRTEFSGGYMLYLYDPDLRYPFFRRGVLRASRGR